MATIKLLRNGEVKDVEVPTSLNTDDDCRIFLTYWKAQGAAVWDSRYVKSLVDAYNSGTVDMDTVMKMANSEIISDADAEWPISTAEILEHIETHNLKLTR